MLISIDTLRSDRLPIYGYASGATPAIDALRRDAILVARAYTHVPLTLPAHASIFTGQLPTEHGVRDNLGYEIAASTATLAEVLAGAGYATGGAVSAAILRHSSGIAAGFEVWDEPGAGRNLGAEEAERPGGETLAAIRPWLREVSKRPFFLFLHLYEPHAPHRPPSDLAGPFASPYDGEVAAADATELARGVAANFPREAAVIEVEAARHALEASLAEGRAAAVAGDNTRALAVLQPLADRGDPGAMVALATVLSQGGRQGEARDYVERALRSDGGDGDALAHETLGLVMLRSGDMPGAIEPLRRASALDPSRANAWNLLGVALERGQGDHAAALGAWQRALALEPDRFDVLYNVATVAASSGDTELARASLARFVAEAPPAQWGGELPRARERLRALGGAP